MQRTCICLSRSNEGSNQLHAHCGLLANAGEGRCASVAVSAADLLAAASAVRGTAAGRECKATSAQPRLRRWLAHKAVALRLGQERRRGSRSLTGPLHCDWGRNAGEGRCASVAVSAADLLAAASAARGRSNDMSGAAPAGFDVDPLAAAVSSRAAAGSHLHRWQ